MVLKMRDTEKGDQACTEFGDKKGNSQNSVMNSSQEGIAHIYALQILQDRINFSEFFFLFEECGVFQVHYIDDIFPLQRLGCASQSNLQYLPGKNGHFEII